MEKRKSYVYIREKKREELVQVKARRSWLGRGRRDEGRGEREEGEGRGDQHLKQRQVISAGEEGVEDV